MAYARAHAILIVEDERIVAKDLQHTLCAMGYDAFAIASSAEDALHHAALRCPDLVLMDVRIKGARDGIETAELLRTRHGVPVVYLTAHADDSTIERAKRTTPDGYLMKPVKSAELRSAIEISIHRHAMARQLRERERWFATTLRSINDAVITVDLEGRITFMNAAAERLTGVSAERATGREARQVVRLDQPGQPVSPLDDVLQHRRDLVFHDAVLETSRDPGRLISGSAALVADSGELLGAAIVFRDITDEKHVQRQLEVADRLASLGTLTSGVAHEINNPLAVVLANASYLRGELEDIGAALDSGIAPGLLADRLRELSQIHGEISNAGWRIGKIVADLKAFSRPADPASSSADIGRAISWAIRTTEHEFRHRARIIHEIAALPPAVADETRLGQVFVNLLMNAAQAMVGTANDNVVAIRSRTEGEHIVVEIRDTGPGIAPDDLRRIFEPFFTTRAIGQGTGLGLSVCHGIIASVGGELQVESEVGVGTTFRVVLRSATARSAAPPIAPPIAVAERRRGRILLVDDDAMVHRTLGRILRDHDVVCADNARDALAAIVRGERFDLILADLLMPVMTGIELHDQLLHHDPVQAHRVVFVTGGARTTAQGDEFLRSVPNLTLEKPFGMPEILALVDRMVGDLGTPVEPEPLVASGKG